MDLNALIGKTCVIIRGATPGSEEIEMFFDDLTHVHFYHQQDCCESVQLEDIVGDIKDLLGKPLGLSEVVCTQDDVNHESSTATWYKFATINGAVTLRWLGVSNGYYSEAVNTDFGTFGLTGLTDAEAVIWDHWLETGKILP